MTRGRGSTWESARDKGVVEGIKGVVLDLVVEGRVVGQGDGRMSPESWVSGLSVE